MELVCNELSFYPLAHDGLETERRFKVILNTFKEAKVKYNFTHIRFPLHYAEQQVNTTQNFFEWVSTIGNNTLKALILALFRKPYTDDLEEDETNRFFESEYEVTSENAPKRDSPIGMPVAYIKNAPSISFDSHAFWTNRIIEITKTNEKSDAENTTFRVFNLCLSTDIESNELNEWAENSFSHFIDNEEKLVNYLSYQRFTTNFTPDFMHQLFEWKETDMKSFKYVLLLMKDVELHPFTGGRGQTENLKYRGKEASKRINNTHRLSYSIEDNVVTFIACNGHYDFH